MLFMEEGWRSPPRKELLNGWASPNLPKLPMRWEPPSPLPKITSRYFSIQNSAASDVLREKISLHWEDRLVLCGRWLQLGLLQSHDELAQHNSRSQGRTKPSEGNAQLCCRWQGKNNGKVTLCYLWNRAGGPHKRFSVTQPYKIPYEVRTSQPSSVNNIVQLYHCVLS